MPVAALILGSVLDGLAGRFVPLAPALVRSTMPASADACRSSDLLASAASCTHSPSVIEIVQRRYQALALQQPLGVSRLLHQPTICNSSFAHVPHLSFTPS